MPVIIAGKNIVAREDSISATPRPSARDHYDSDSLIRTTLIAIDRRDGAIASVRPIGFALHCRRNKS